MKTVYYYYTKNNGVLTENEMIAKVVKMTGYEKEKFDEEFSGKLATVCLIDNGKNVSRGISLLSKNDTFILEEGNINAFAKADRCMKGRKIHPFGNNNVIPIIINTKLPFNQPAELNPELTMFEKRLLKKKIELKTKEQASRTLTVWRREWV